MPERENEWRYAVTVPFIIPGLTAGDMETLLTKRNYAYYCDSVKRLQNGECAFCVFDTSLNQVLVENDSWRAWSVPLKFRKKHLKAHFVLATKRHVLHYSELSREEWMDQFDVLQELHKQFDISGGGLVTRFGDPALNACSVQHLHTNIVIPDCTGEVAETLAKTPEKIAQAWQIMAVYEKLRQGTPVENLTDEEKKLVEGRL